MKMAGVNGNFVTPAWRDARAVLNFEFAWTTEGNKGNIGWNFCRRALLHRFDWWALHRNESRRINVIPSQVSATTKIRAPLKIQVSRQDKARVKNLSAAYS